MASEHGGKDTANFPMAAAEFQAKVNARETKARAKMEERVAKLDATKAAEARTKFDAKIAAVNAEVAKATADGTVTKDEAKAVHQAWGHGHHHKGGEKGSKGEPKKQ
jgi:hypothetical protein